MSTNPMIPSRKRLLLRRKKLIACESVTSVTEVHKPSEIVESVESHSVRGGRTSKGAKVYDRWIPM